jgi:hypothetical protein
MTPRAIMIVGSVVVCGAALWGVLAQGRQVSELQAEQMRLESARLVTNAPPAEFSATPTPTPEVPRELLQLRAEVARLSQRQRELSGARQENEKLRLKLENRRTNNAANHAGSTYIRTAEAKWVGYNTPEDTLQSLFWAAKNRNVEKFLEGLTPETAGELKDQIGKSENHAQAIESILESATLPPLFEIVGREQLADGSIGLKIQIVNGNADESRSVDTSEPLGFKQIGGQWKLSKPH